MLGVGVDVDPDRPAQLLEPLDSATDQAVGMLESSPPKIDRLGTSEEATTGTGS